MSRTMNNRRYQRGSLVPRVHHPGNYHAPSTRSRAGRSSRIRRSHVPQQPPSTTLTPGIPRDMLVLTEDGNTGAKEDKFGRLSITTVELEGDSWEKVESLAWLQETEQREGCQGVAGQQGEQMAKEKGEGVPKNLQCLFCLEVLEAAILLPCCVAAACDECARNSLKEGDLVCRHCGDTDIRPAMLIPNPLLRKKAAAWKDKRVPAEVMLHQQREAEREERRLEEAVLAELIEEEATNPKETMGDFGEVPDNQPITDLATPPVIAIKAASPENSPASSPIPKPEPKLEEETERVGEKSSSPQQEDEAETQDRQPCPFEFELSISRVPSPSPAFTPVLSIVEQENASPVPTCCSSTSTPAQAPASTSRSQESLPVVLSSSERPEGMVKAGEGEATYTTQSMSAAIPGQGFQTTASSTYTSLSRPGFNPDYSPPLPTHFVTYTTDYARYVGLG